MEKFSIGMDISDVVTAANMNEIADAVNKVNNNFRSGDEKSFFSVAKADGWIRISYSGENLRKYAVVELEELYLTPDNCSTFESEKVTFSAGIVSDPRKNFAILSAPVNNNEISYAVMIGITPALIKIKDGSHNFAKPSETFPGYLESSESGPAKILWKSENNNTELCIVELGGSTGSSASDFSYKSYFKIVDASETAEDGTITNKISVVDGYGRGYNRCKVNNKAYDLKYHTETITKTSLIALRFNASEKKVEYYISDDTTLPDDGSEYSYCQLGIVTIADSVMTIQQDHLCGIAQMFAYRFYSC